MPIETSPAPFQNDQAGYSYSGSLNMAPPAAPLAALQSHTPAAAAANTLIAAESGAMATPFKAIAALPEAGYTAPVQHAHRFDNTPPANGYARASIAGYGGSAVGMGGGMGGGGTAGMNGGAMSMYGGMPGGLGGMGGNGVGGDMPDAYPYSHSIRSGVPAPRGSIAPMPMPMSLSRSISMPLKPQMMTVPLPSSLHHHHGRHDDQYDRHRPLHLQHHHSHSHLDIDDGASDCSYYARPKRASSTRMGSYRQGNASGLRASRSRSRSYTKHEEAIHLSDSDSEGEGECPDCQSRVEGRHVGGASKQRERQRQDSMISPRQRLPGPNSPPDSPLQDYMRRLKLHDERDKQSQSKRSTERPHAHVHARAHAHARSPSRRSLAPDRAADRGVMSDTEVVRPSPRGRRAADHSIPPSPRIRVSDASGKEKENAHGSVHGNEGEREKGQGKDQEHLYRQLPKDTVDQFKRNRRRSDVHGHGLRPDSALLNVPPTHHARSRLGSDVAGGRRPRHGSLGAYEHDNRRQRVASQRYDRDHILHPCEHDHHSENGYAPSVGSNGGARSWVSPSAFHHPHAHGLDHAHANGVSPRNDGFPFPASQPGSLGLGPDVAHLNPMVSASELGVGVSGVGGQDGRVSQYGLPKYPHQPKVDYRRFMVQRGNADVYLD